MLVVVVVVKAIASAGAAAALIVSEEDGGYIIGLLGKQDGGLLCHFIFSSEGQKNGYIGLTIYQGIWGFSTGPLISTELFPPNPNIRLDMIKSPNY